MMPVVKRCGKTFEIVYISLDDVLFTFMQGGTICYQTAYDVFSQISTVEEQERFLADYGFSRIERGYLARLDRAQEYDSQYGLLMFDGGLSAPVSKPKETILRDRLLRLKRNTADKPRYMFA
ncbi:LytTR family transcriptional regulator DNA-binding domain-containing protein [Paenibacillus solisilvae]|uniref:LytTR family transcriptional regulator DNA-binding domain-containing protein n=1 Tax=Paenibacillus solisilvae TaxID=2486751 RepID=A0ABW0W1M0_9BACL